MENIIIYAEITATSKKQGEFIQENPTKTAYLKVSENTAKYLQEFGLTEYESRNGEKFFAIKFASKLQAYFGTDEDMEPEDFSSSASIETNNFKTADGVPVGMNIIKGENKGNEFFRIQALLLNSMEDLEEVKPTNPFA